LLTYKRAHVLTRTLEQLLAQTHSNIELIINDNCSPDDTEAIARKFEAADSRVRYFRNPVNLGYAGNQNAAIARARSDFVAIVHDGDAYRADAVEQWLLALLRHPSAAIAFSAMDGMDREGRVVHHHRHPFPPLVSGRELLDQMLGGTGSPIYGIAMVRRATVLAVGPFDLRFPALADVDMWMRILLRADAAYVSEPIVTVYPRERDHPNRSENWGIYREHEAIYAANIVRRYPLRGEEANAMLKRTRRALWKIRRGRILSCARHRKITPLLVGLRICLRRPLVNPWA
jgi:glycosyltransferase involved in cell wall biosynthesis